jgi:hypothetical protein
MNIDDIKLGDIKALLSMFSAAPAAEITTPHIGKKCIIHTYASGVHFGTVVAQSGRQVELKDARRLWRWDAKGHGISLSEVANHGGTGGRHLFCEVVEAQTLLDALEIIPATDKAIREIEAAPVAEAT